MTLKAREMLLDHILNQNVIDISELKYVCFQGIPENGSWRSLTWKLLLNYLPLRKTDWNDFLTKQRKFYQSLLEDLLSEPTGSSENGQDDHPLSVNPTSQWSAYFKENDILAQIDKDVRRLCPELSFFQKPTESKIPRGKPLCHRVTKVILESEVLTKSRSGATNLIRRKCAAEEYQPLENGREAHWQVVERILFIYSKLNPGVGYVQGMNEILGPIYYVFASDSNAEWRENAEADTFFCFQNLMSEIKDDFIKKLDDSNCGIENKMALLYQLLSEIDPQLHKFITEDQDLMPQYYAFRWLSLMLSQEFVLPDVIRIWDSLFSDRKRFDFLLYVCLAMLILVRDDLMANEFPVNMKTLQNYPSTDIDIRQILLKAAELYQQ